MNLIMWTTFDQYYSDNADIIVYMLEPLDWVVTLAHYDPELINYEYQPKGDL